MKAGLIHLIWALLLAQEGPLLIAELWPGEGVPVFIAVGAPIELRAGPAVTAPLLRMLDYPAGSEATFDATEFQTLAPGVLLARRATQVGGTDLGPIRRLTRDTYYFDRSPPAAFLLEPGDTVHYLQPRAEGTCFLSVNGKVWDVDQCLGLIDLEFDEISSPVLQWWIRITEDDAPQGWVLVSPETLSVERKF